jgi:hypothetical protein
MHLCLSIFKTSHAPLLSMQASKVQAKAGTPADAGGERLKYNKSTSLFAKMQQQKEAGVSSTAWTTTTGSGKSAVQLKL